MREIAGRDINNTKCVLNVFDFKRHMQFCQSDYSTLKKPWLINEVHFFAMKTICQQAKPQYSKECDINVQKILHTIKMLHVNKPYIKSGEYSAEALKP